VLLGALEIIGSVCINASAHPRNAANHSILTYTVYDDEETLDSALQRHDDYALASKEAEKAFEAKVCEFDQRAMKHERALRRLFRDFAARMPPASAVPIVDATPGWLLGNRISDWGPGQLLDTPTRKEPDRPYWEGLAVDVTGQPFLFSTTNFEICYRAESTKELELDQKGYLCESILSTLGVSFEDPSSGACKAIPHSPGRFYDHYSYRNHPDQAGRLVELVAGEMARALRSCACATKPAEKSSWEHVQTYKASDVRAPRQRPERSRGFRHSGPSGPVERASRIRRKERVKTVRAQELVQRLVSIGDPIERILQTLGSCTVVRPGKILPYVESGGWGGTNSTTPAVLEFVHWDVVNRTLPGFCLGDHDALDYGALVDPVDDRDVARWFARRATEQSIPTEGITWSTHRIGRWSGRPKQPRTTSCQGWPPVSADGQLLLAPDAHLTAFGLVRMANVLGFEATAKDVPTEVLSEMSDSAYYALA
jgi:hypothetical protein